MARFEGAQFSAAQQGNCHEVIVTVVIRFS
jgi:hypothetical protein